MALTYREMTAADLPAIFALRLSTNENAVTMAELEEVYGVTPASLAEGLKSRLKGWLCEEEGKALGFAMGDRENGEVQVVAVLPGVEGRGIGRVVLAHVSAWLFGAGHQEIWLLANPDPEIRATGFYRRLGWRPNGRWQGEDHVLILRRGETDAEQLG